MKSENSWVLLLTCLVLAACSGGGDGSSFHGDGDDEGSSSGTDVDGDGVSIADGDCDDSNPFLYPYDSDGDGTADRCGWKDLEAGNGVTCGIDSSDAIQCWGLNNLGQAMPPSGSFTRVSSGHHHACAIDSGGAVQK